MKDTYFHSLYARFILQLCLKCKKTMKADQCIKQSHVSYWCVDVMEGKAAILLGMSQWNSNDLVEQIETLGHLEHSRGMYIDLTQVSSKALFI